MTRTILSLVLFLAVSGCTSNASSKWRYDFKIAAAETRSEHLVGSLTFGGAALRKELGRVVAPIGEFMYVDESARGFPPQTNWVPCRTEADGSLTSGYYSKMGRELLASKTLRKTTIAAGSNKKIGEAEIKKGFYASGFHSKLDGTPSHWFYCVTLGYWIDPLKIGEMLQESGKLASPNLQQ